MYLQVEFLVAKFGLFVKNNLVGDDLLFCVEVIVASFCRGFSFFFYCMLMWFIVLFS